MIEFLPLVVLGLAAYRLTRLLVIDTIFEGSRNRLHTFLVNRQHGKLRLFWDKAHDLLSCTWCSGTWVSVALYSVFVWHNPTDFTRLDWISVLAIAAIQGLLHSFEPEDG